MKAYETMSNDKLVMTERGIGRPLAPYDVQVSFGNRNAPGADWFGPGAPMPPVAPPEVGGRVWDYSPGFNLTTQPRASEPISFEAMRAIADAYDPVRLIIEKRKDQIGRLAWKIRAKHDGPGKRPKDEQLPAQLRGTIRDIKEFFAHPDGSMSFRSWLRCLLDDLLVLDAPAIFCERDSFGNLVALTPVDGSTVRIVIDQNGRPAREFRWDGQPFAWCGQTVTVSNYAELGFKITRGLMWPPVYGRTMKGMGVANLTAWDLIYAPMNLRTTGVYGHSPVAAIATSVSIATRRALGMLEYFREGNQPDAFYALPDTWTPDQIANFQSYFDAHFSGDLARRRHLKFMPGGSKSSYIPTREPPLVSDFDEHLLRIVCFAFSYSPAAFVTLNNRSTAEQHERQSEEEGLQPLKLWVSELINGIIEREFSEEVEFAWTEENEVDAEREAKILRGYVSDGILSINEARERLGEEPLRDEAASTPRLKTATGYVSITPDVADDDDDTEKLAKGAIVMLPPAGGGPRRPFTIGATTFTPNLAKGGQLIVFSEGDAAELEIEGWKRSTKKEKQR